MDLVMIGDVGVTGGMIHIGDEAMLDEALHQLRLRGADRVTVVSSAPGETSGRYGVESIARIGFSSGASSDRAADVERMRRVTLTAAGRPGLLPPDDPAHAVIEAVRRSDGVLIAGGGNLASTWPLHIFERATLGAIAAELGRPLVVSGQTIGPHLTAPDAELVAGLLASARRVGLRERDSYDLCVRLGVPRDLLRLTTDDASFVGDRAAGGSGLIQPTPCCLVSFSAHLGGVERALFVSRAAAMLDALALSTGLSVVFLAHWGSLAADEVRGDSVLHEAVRAAMASSSAVVAPVDSVSAAALARGAGFVVTSRYHPAVFAASGGVPIVAIAVDDYTTVKLTGALGHFGQDAVLPIADMAGPARASGTGAAADDVTSTGTGAGTDAATGTATPTDPATAIALVDRVWARRDEIAAAGSRAAQSARNATAAWWDEIAASFA
jgi:polysaccharide pyruvyl transferase WcaK-like protein